MNGYVEVQAVLSCAGYTRIDRTHIWILPHVLCILDPHGQYTAKVLIPEDCEAPNLHRRTDRSITLVSQRLVACAIHLCIAGDTDRRGGQLFSGQILLAVRGNPIESICALPLGLIAREDTYQASVLYLVTASPNRAC